MASRPESQSSPPKADDSVKFDKNFLTASLRGPASKEVNDRYHGFLGDLHLEEPKYHLAQTKLDEYKELRKDIEALEKRHDTDSLFKNKPSRISRKQSAIFGNKRVSIEGPENWCVWVVMSRAPKSRIVSMIQALRPPSQTMEFVLMAQVLAPSLLWQIVTTRKVCFSTIVLVENQWIPFSITPTIFLLQIRNNMLAPVEIVYGVPTWERTQNILQGNLQHFDLWGTCKGITIYLEWENIRANSNRLSRSLRRFLISAYHPQNMMRAWGKRFSANQDRLLETGYRLACVDFLEHFYERQLWRPIVRFLPHAHFSMNRALKLESIRALERLQTLRLEHEDSTTKAEARRRLRGLACALRKEEKGEKETKEWGKLEGVEGVEEKETCGNAEAVMRLSSAKHTVASSGKPAVWDFSHLLDNENDVVQSPSEVECFCIACMGNTNHGTSGDPVVVDDKPRWTKTTPPKYIERRLECKNCGKARRFIPIKADIPSLSDNQVRDFLRTHGGLLTEDQLLAFQSVLSASQNHRWQIPEGRQTRVDKIKRYRRLMPQYLEKREGLKVHTMCSSCGRKGIDLSPCWLKGTEVYYAKQIVDCTAAKCQTIRTYMIPVDESMRYKKHRNLLLQMNKDLAQLKDNTESKRIATLESSPNRGRSKKT